MKVIDVDMYLEKVKHEAMAMPEEQGETFVMLTEWLLGKTPTIEVSNWTPCKTRLPNVGERVWITAKDRKGKWVTISSLYENGLWSNQARGTKVIAWKPLPEPWDGKSK